jgi:hypothetical protein
MAPSASCSSAVNTGKDVVSPYERSSKCLHRHCNDGGGAYLPLEGCVLPLEDRPETLMRGKLYTLIALSLHLRPRKPPRGLKAVLEASSDIFKAVFGGLS